MIQVRVPLSQSPDTKVGGLRAADDLVSQQGVVLYTQFGLGRAEGGHVSGSATARRDMEIVDVHNLVGRGDDQHLRLPGRRLLCGGLVSIDGRLDFLLPPTSYCGNDQRRVRDDHCAKNRHIASSSLNILHQRLQR